VIHNQEYFSCPVPPGALHLHLGCAEILACEFDCGRAKVLLQAVHLPRAWGRHDPGLSRRRLNSHDDAVLGKIGLDQAPHWRIWLEPRRLFWRYLTTNPRAIYLLFNKSSSNDRTPRG
jgi:hypothetical protein